MRAWQPFEAVAYGGACFAAEGIGALDFIVQSLALVSQLFLTGRIVQRLGIVVLLTAVPVVMTLGFLWLALAPAFAVFAAVMVMRRAGEYALARPGREMLFTVLGPGCESVTWKDGVVTGTWKDGRIGTFRAAKGYKATVTGDKGIHTVTGMLEGPAPFFWNVEKSGS